MYDDFNFMDAVSMPTHDGVEGSLKFNTHRCWTFDGAMSMTIRTIKIVDTGQAFFSPLASHLHKAQRRNWKDIRARLVSSKTFTESLIDSLLVFTVLHINKICDDNASNIAKAELTGNFICSFEVGLKNGFPYILYPFVTARINIDGNHCLCFINDNVATAG